MVCLGTVVWGIAYVFKGVFPIHWSSNEPVLEFPVDLLVYNSLMPIVIKFFKPSKGLTAMYKWWFQKCARALRLSHFLFNAREKDEEGHWKKSSSVGDSSQDSVWVPDGRYVRAPASDQVRIPKGGTAFIDVDEYNERKDGKPDTEQGLHGRQNKMFSLVFIPPHFRCRIAAFIVLLWLFAATTGVGTTIIPLLFGRRVFTYLIPSHLRMNDLYAFAIGIYLLGGPIYLVAQHHKKIISSFRKLIYEPPTKLSAFRRLLSRAYHVSIRGLRLFYFYGAFTLLLPSMVALLFETFFLIPLHTYFFRTENPPPPHTIHFIQDWTLGVLYVRVATRIILFYRTSRPAQALRATVSSSNNGASYWNPDIRLATRAFIFPASVLMITALLFPLGFGWLVNTFWFRGADDGMRATVYRYSFPALLAIGLVFAIAKLIRAAVHGWRARIKDEVYLIGERLHNFGDQQKRPSVNRVATR